MLDYVKNLYRMLPSALQRSILVRRRAPIWLETGIVFIHIPKAAGTSINEALYGRFMGHVRASDVHRWGSPAVRALPSFAVTRNPWDRLVSTYRFLKRGSGVGGSNRGRVWRAEQYRVPEFRTFDRFVFDWLPGRELEKLDIALHPQYLFVLNEYGGLLVDHLGKLEDLQPTFQFLREKVPGFEMVNRSNRSGAAVDYRSFYTPKLVDAVGAMYSMDVARFEYTFE